MKFLRAHEKDLYKKGRDKIRSVFFLSMSTSCGLDLFQKLYTTTINRTNQEGEIINTTERKLNLPHSI